MSRPEGEDLAGLAQGYLEWLEVRHYSKTTVRSRGSELSFFLDWCRERAVADPAEVTAGMLERYRRSVYLYRKANGQPLSIKTQRLRLHAVRHFFHWLARTRTILDNPAADLELPKVGQHLPRDVLTAPEVEAVLAKPDLSTPLGLRDRAMLETFYSTGIRRLELVQLRLDSLDRSRGTVFVREGKGRKDRVVPIGERALAWIEKYLSDARPHLARSPDEPVLFLTAQGTPITPGHVTGLVGDYLKAAGVRDQGACHLFRHSMATLMLEAGAEMRYLQHMLGHSQITTTQVYTRVAIGRLKEIHARTHPARLGRTSTEETRAAEDEREERLTAYVREAEEETETDEKGGAPRTSRRT